MLNRKDDDRDGGRHSRPDGRERRVRAGHRQDRPDRADDRPAGLDRQADRAPPSSSIRQQHGDTVAGKKIEVILKDDGAVPDNTKRIAQELIVNDKVNFIAGFGVTPAALAAAPLATQAKVPLIVMAAGTSIITERSPYIARTSFTLAQSVGDHRRLGAARTTSRRSSPWCRTMRPAPTPRSRSPNASRRRAARSSRRSACRSPIRTSRRSCSAPPTPSPTRCSSSCRPDRAAPS